MDMKMGRKGEKKMSFRERCDIKKEPQKKRGGERKIKGGRRRSVSRSKVEEAPLPPFFPSLLYATSFFPHDHILFYSREHVEKECGDQQRSL